MKKAFVLIFLTCSAFLSAQGGISKKDSNFVRMAAEHTELEIMMAQLAQTNASAPEVKALASDLQSFHTKALGELKMLAGRKNIMLTPGLSERSKKHYDKLSKKQGADFDRAYTKCVVQTHKMGACHLEKESKKGKDSDITSWARSTYPVLEQLRDKAKETCKTIKHKT